MQRLGSEQFSVTNYKGLLENYGAKSTVEFLVTQVAMPNTSEPNFFPANLSLKNSISDSDTHGYVRMAHVGLQFMLSTFVWALKRPSSWNSFLSST